MVASATTAASTVSRSRSPRHSLDRVFDPEIPVLSIADLGILRGVIEHEDESVEVIITPTYSGCPAMDVIKDDIITELSRDGFADATVTTVLSPAWTTDWMSDEGKRKLREYGIAPPTVRAGGPVPVTLRMRPPEAEVSCPQCGAPGREVSRFGSTACKSMYVCTNCLEPFDHFKTI